jgi:hypothetical protein
LIELPLMGNGRERAGPAPADSRPAILLKRKLEIGNSQKCVATLNTEKKSECDDWQTIKSTVVLT